MDWIRKIIDTTLWVLTKGKEKAMGGSTFTVTKYETEKPPQLMALRLDREWYTSESTIGRLYVDDVYECYILEDYDRLRERKVKKHGETAIPSGVYEVRLTQSPRFKRVLPLLINVPGFSGIRIHPGNTARDTEGCLLPGDTRGNDFVGQSRKAFNRLLKKLERAKDEGKRIEITIE